ncbi:MAG: hypothetical protein KA072_03875, partial [Thermoanaerobaculaceae bacterium]|nr:hypothetical protein [Thermoanaerobaculaceae bacterium]MDI9620773.1 hypothetical protein [Acidobacteriota bacterium]
RAPPPHRLAGLLARPGGFPARQPPALPGSVTPPDPYNAKTSNPPAILICRVALDGRRLGG